MTLLERARTNRLNAVGSLASHKATNVFFIEEARKRRSERAEMLQFSTTRRTFQGGAGLARRRHAA